MDGQSSESQQLRALVSRFVADELDAPTFCVWFERAYNVDTDKAGLTDRERQAFEGLFNEVVYYSPFPDERAEIPNYRSDEQIRHTARAVAATLA